MTGAGRAGHTEDASTLPQAAGEPTPGECPVVRQSRWLGWPEALEGFDTVPVVLR